jgi:hypothetical protein
MGHEYAGIVEEVGAEVTTIKPGQFVVGSFFAFDNTCEICRAGYQTSCIHREPSAPAQRMRVPLADGTLVATPEVPTTTWCRTFWPPPTCWEPGGSAPWPPRPDQEGPCGERRPVPHETPDPAELVARSARLYWRRSLRWCWSQQRPAPQRKTRPVRTRTFQARRSHPRRHRQSLAIRRPPVGRPAKDPP